MSASSLDAINAGLRAWSEQRYYDAHEDWESVWLAEPDPEIKSGLQGLIQLAGSLHKAHRGEPAGHAKLWAKARERVARAAEARGAVRGIDMVRVLDDMPTEPVVRPPRLPERVHAFGVVYLHGFGSTPNGHKGSAIVSALRADGVPVHAPLLADAEDFMGFTVTRSLGRARRGMFDRTLLIGSSLGGWTGALVARDEPRIVEMILLCPAFRFGDRWTRPDRAEAVAQWRAEGQLDFEVGHPPRMAPLGVGFLDDVLALDGWVRPEVPTTVFHGTRDIVVPLADVTSVVHDNPQVDLRVRDDDHELRSVLPEIVDLVRQRVRALR